MSIISIIKVHTISPEELNMYLAEFIRSFRLKDREDYEPSGLACLISSIERYSFAAFTPSTSDTTISGVNTIKIDFARIILYLYHLYYQISMSASVEAILVTWVRIVPTLTTPTNAPVRKDTLGTDTHAKV